jgi:hypothetical protein
MGGSVGIVAAKAAAVVFHDPLVEVYPNVT